MIGKPIRKKAIYRATRLCRGKQRKTEGEETKKGRNKVRLCRYYNDVLLLYFVDPEKARGCLVSPEQFRNTRLKQT